ncbi:MAG: translation initiation factor IF-2 [Patescibacteria group bacterium]|nr:translation initiation factor IF-2 [Patescibacteria group bacterium]
MPKDQQNLVPRPPVVVVMGHIDHGKSTLLDYIRKTEVVKGEAGGITQHVGAYQAEHTSSDGKKHNITFLDTPGHEAFCSIRERGAQAADVAILVVSAEDGVKPQTIEAMGEIRAAKIPFVVAINKIDKPNADIDKTKTSLGENEIYVEGWGGDVPWVAISALNGKGIPELLDLVILTAELAELKADPAAAASGIVIESELDTRKGITATLLIKDGSLGTGSFVVAEDAYAPVRFIEDFKGDKIEPAGPSMPVIISSWTKIPSCGSLFATVSTKKEAERMIQDSRFKIQEEKRAKAKPIEAHKKAKGELAADQFGYKKGEPETVVLPIIVKADTIGSLDGVRHELDKIRHDKVQLRIVYEGIGDINENDVKLAVSDPSTLLVGFNAEPDKKSAAMIERSPVPISVRSFKVIYELTDFVKETFLAKAPKEFVEQMIGRAKILAVFSKAKDKQVVGGKVETGLLETGSEVRIMRREADIGRGKIRELQQQKERVSEVREGYEFGMMIESKAEIAAGDRIEAVRTVEK